MRNGFPEQQAYFTKLRADYEIYNEKCEQDKIDMTLTRSQNIASKLSDWTFQENDDYIEKTFEFNSFEEAQAFTRQVGAVCEKMDHHPEWQSSNNG